MKTYDKLYLLRKFGSFMRMSWVVFDPRGLKSFQFDSPSPEEFPDTLTFKLWVRVL